MPSSRFLCYIMWKKCVSNIPGHCFYRVSYSVCALVHPIVCMCPDDHKARFELRVFLTSQFKFDWRYWVEILSNSTENTYQHYQKIWLIYNKRCLFTSLLATVNFFLDTWYLFCGDGRPSFSSRYGISSIQQWSVMSKQTLIKSLVLQNCGLTHDQNDHNSISMGG